MHFWWIWKVIFLKKQHFCWPSFFEKISVSPRSKAYPITISHMSSHPQVGAWCDGQAAQHKATWVCACKCFIAVDFSFHSTGQQQTLHHIASPLTPITSGNWFARLWGFMQFPLPHFRFLSFLLLHGIGPTWGASGKASSEEDIATKKRDSKNMTLLWRCEMG